MNPSRVGSTVEAGGDLMFSQHTLSIFKCHSVPGTPAAHVHPFIITVHQSPDGSFQHNKAPFQKPHIISNCLRA